MNHNRRYEARLPVQQVTLYRVVTRNAVGGLLADATGRILEAAPIFRRTAAAAGWNLERFQVEIARTWAGTVTTMPEGREALIPK